MSNRFPWLPLEENTSSLFTNGIHTGITFQYVSDPNFPKVNATVTGGGTGGGGGTGDVTLSGIQTLTNKTMSGLNNTFTNLPNSALTNPYIQINGSPVYLGGSVTFVGDVTLTGVETLSNKTLLSPSLVTPDIGVATGTSLTLSGNAVVQGNLTVNGTQNILNLSNLQVQDKNIELGVVAAPGVADDTTAEAGGFTLKGATDKTWLWKSVPNAWTSNVNINLDPGFSYKINNTTVLTSTQVLGKSLPSGTVLGSSDVQTITNKNISGLQNNITNIPNSALLNNFITINGTNVELGNSITVAGGGGGGAGTYDISAETGSGTSAKVRITDALNNYADEITLLGTNGVTVVRDNANQISIQGPNLASLITYSDDDAKDAAAAALAAGTHIGIAVTYDSNNRAISLTNTGGGGGGGSTILYDFYGSNTTSNQVILNLQPSSGAIDAVEFGGAGGTTVSWDGVNKKATIQSTAPVNADWNATSGLAEILNKPTIPAAYVLPTASTSTIGGIRIDGSTILIDQNGVISAAPSGYVLPYASDTTLGGIRIGPGLQIDQAGIVSVAVGSGTGLQSRDALSGTTTSIADNASAELNITGYKSYSLYKIETSHAAWVRIYTDDAARDQDRTRSENVDPLPGSGVIAEVSTSGAETVLLTPGVIGFNNDSPVGTTIYAEVTNRSGSSAAITVTLTALRLEV